MGQYFKSSIETQSGKKLSLSARFCSKMMEWGYLDNTSLMLVAQYIKEITGNGEPVRYIHAGDYSELFPKAYDYPVDTNISDVFDERLDAINEEYRAAESSSVKYDALVEEQNTYYLYNHTKREMVCIESYRNASHNTEPTSPDGWAVHPLAILCCTEQGLGDGDYAYCFEGEQLEKGGRWVGDEISIADELKIGFKDITFEMRLTLNTEDYRELKDHVSLDELVLSYGKF